MTELYEVLIQYASIWAPSLVAILGIAFTVISTLANASKTFKAFKEDKTLSDLSRKCDEVLNQNKDLIRKNNLLLDEITKIKRYSENVKED